MKAIGSTKGKITKNGNGENVPHFEITEIVLVHFCIYWFLINRLVNY